MNKYREPWPWEVPEEPALKPWDGSYYGFRVDPLKRRCVADNTPLLEFITSDEGTYLECRTCKGRLVARPGADRSN